MKTKLQKEKDILNIDFRKVVIEEVIAAENSARKDNARKRYNIFKDDTKRYVEVQLRKELDGDTVEEMIHRTPNISFGRVIIDRKAMVFKDGVKVEINDEAVKDKTKDQVHEVADYIKLASNAKKLNKFSELFKNTAAYVVPIKEKDTGKWYYKIKVLQPYLYDVIEDEQDPEVGRVWLFSYFNQRDNRADSSGITNFQGERTGATTRPFDRGDNTDQVIADAPVDFNKDTARFVWWSRNYHFTTNGHGATVDMENNPSTKNQ